MTDVIVSFRVEKKLHKRMKAHKEINWSAVLRQAVEEQVPVFDQAKRIAASRDIDRMREAYARAHGKSEKTSVELVKECREKRTKQLLTHQ